MGFPIDLTGQKIQKLKIISRFSIKNEKNQTKAFYNCVCECGKERIVKSGLLLRGSAKSCGDKICEAKIHFKKYEGKKFGHLTLIGFSHHTENKHYVDTICECGTECKKSFESIYQSKTASCGCKTLHYNKKNAYNKGNPAKNRLKDQLGAKNSLFSRYKKGAKHRNLEFSLKFDDFVNLVTSPCHYCGIESKKQHPAKLYKGNDLSRCFYYNGLDRVDNNKGYIEENVVSCCEDCNYAKTDLSAEQFLKLIERIYNHSIKKKD